MLQSQSAPLAQKQIFGLHLLLVMGIILYVYSPLLDHWLGAEHYVRPHTHAYLPETISTEISTLYHFDAENHLSTDGDHEENILCSLDIKTLLYVVLNVNVILIVQNVPLIFDIFPHYVGGSSVYLPSLDPPPRIFS